MWPAIENESLSRFSVLLDEFPDLFNAAIFYITNIRTFCIINKKKRLFVLLLRKKINGLNVKINVAAR